MDVVHERCAGLDVHKRTVVACVLVPGEAGTVQPETETFSTMLGELERLAGWLAERRVTHVALEATGVYWKAVYNVLEGADRWTVMPFRATSSARLRTSPATPPFAAV